MLLVVGGRRGSSALASTELFDYPGFQFSGTWLGFQMPRVEQTWYLSKTFTSRLWTFHIYPKARNSRQNSVKYKKSPPLFKFSLSCNFLCNLIHLVLLFLHLYLLKRVVTSWFYTILLLVFCCKIIFFSFLATSLVMELLYAQRPI